MVAKRLPEIVSWALELFQPLGTIRTRAMFGGYGFYCDDLFFALMAEEVLYLKADDEETQAKFKAAGSEPFRYTYPDGRSMTMGYWSAPEEALECATAMHPWARLAFACALRAGAKKAGR